MPMQSGPFFETFSCLPDPRSDVNKKHLMIDMLFIALCGVLCGLRRWEEVADFAKARKEWFKKYLELPNGIPSHDSIRYLFLYIDQNAFNKTFSDWTSKIAGSLKNCHVAIDGKASRRSASPAKGIKALHTVSAWASSNSLALGQVHVREKSNEITAIPELLELLELNGCLITIDAMGCQKDIAEKIKQVGGEYILAVKANQKYLHAEIEGYFTEAEKVNFKEVKGSHKKTIDKEHGRIETRDYYVINDLETLFEVKKWPHTKSIAIVVAERRIAGQVQKEKRYYLSSLDGEIERTIAAIRGHWGIENSLHWTLDVCFNEDQCRKRSENAAANMTIIRKIAVNMLKTETSFKGSINRKFLRACLDQDYLAKVLGI